MNRNMPRPLFVALAATGLLLAALALVSHRSQAADAPLQSLSQRLFPAITPPPAAATTLKENSELKLQLKVTTHCG